MKFNEPAFVFLTQQAGIPFAKIILKYTFLERKTQSDLNKGKKFENCVDTMVIAVYM